MNTNKARYTFHISMCGGLCEEEEEIIASDSGEAWDKIQDFYPPDANITLLREEPLEKELYDN